MKPILSPGIYGILAEKFSRGRSNVEVAAEMVKAGVTTLQYREKPASKSMGNMFEECVAIRKITREAGVTFIVNDHADLALMVQADGIHPYRIGDDLSVFIDPGFLFIYDQAGTLVASPPRAAA